MERGDVQGLTSKEGVIGIWLSWVGKVTPKFLTPEEGRRSRRRRELMSSGQGLLTLRHSGLSQRGLDNAFEAHAIFCLPLLPYS